MAEQHIDVIVTPQNTGHSIDFQANTRYLTHCGGGGDADIAVVFPLEATSRPSRPRRSPLDDSRRIGLWMCARRGANYGKVVERLRSWCRARPHWGHRSGRSRGTRTPEGTIPHGTWVKMREAFPKAEIIDATPILTETRYIKSQEEIEVLDQIDGDRRARLSRPRSKRRAPVSEIGTFGPPRSTRSCATARRCRCTATGSPEKTSGAP